MNQLGSPKCWLRFIESRVPEIIEVVLNTWDTFPAPFCDELEDKITDRLCVALRRSRDRCELPFRIDTQLVELDPVAGEDQGRMDIVFSPPAPREDIYFCLECKRINVRTETGVRPYFSEYVIHGMLRFVRGQYAKASKHGGMIAYVLDGNIEKAISGVESNLGRHVTELGIDSPGQLYPSSMISNDHRVKETLHSRCDELREFLIHHLFVAGDPAMSLRPKD